MFPFDSENLGEGTNWESLILGANVSFVLDRDAHASCAVNVRLTKKPPRSTFTVLLQLEESSTAPAADLEPQGEQLNQFLSRRLAAYQNFAHEVSADENPSALRATAVVYMEAMTSFERKQRESQAESLLSNTSKCDADVAERLVRQHDACLQLLLDAPAPLTLAHLHDAHAALGQGGLIPDAGRPRAVACRAGRFGFLPAREVEPALRRWLECLAAVEARRDLSPAAKAAWAHCSLLASHPYRDGNGRRVARATGDRRRAGVGPKGLR